MGVFSIIPAGLKRRLKESSLFCKGFDFLQRMEWVSPRGFHGDRIFQNMVLAVIRGLGVTAFVETGTFLGDSSAFVASRERRLPIFTCELNTDYFRVAKVRMENFRNVRIENRDARVFLSQLLSSGRLGRRPVFFLDAHWYDDWPLEDEIEMIGRKAEEAVMIIDDFQVPGREDFKFDMGGGGSSEFSGRRTTDERPCNWDLVRPRINTKNRYGIFYPDYSASDAYPPDGRRRLVGHAVILQNIGEQLEVGGYRMECPERIPQSGTAGRPRAG